MVYNKKAMGKRIAGTVPVYLGETVLEKFF